MEQIWSRAGAGRRRRICDRSYIQKGERTQCTFPGESVLVVTGIELLEIDGGVLGSSRKCHLYGLIVRVGGFDSEISSSGLPRAMMLSAHPLG
jgi:hypothetical protein